MIRGIISRRKDVVRSQGRGQNLLDAGSEYIAIDPSPWSLGPVAFPWLDFDDPRRAAQPRSGVMLVFAQVSSMNTNLFRSIPP